MGVFIKGWIQPQLQAHTTSLGPSCPGSPCPPASRPGPGTQDRTPGRRQEAPWGGKMEEQIMEWMGVARDGAQGCEDGPRYPASQGHGLRGNLPSGSASLAPSSRGPAGGGPAAGRAVCSSCCIPKVFPAIIWAIARPPPWAPASIPSLPTHPPQLEEAGSLPNIPFSLYIRQSPGFVLGGCITSG